MPVLARNRSTGSPRTGTQHDENTRACFPAHATTSFPRWVLLQITVIESLIEKCDVILLGGGMIFTFYKAKGLSVGKSLVRGGKNTALLVCNTARQYQLFRSPSSSFF